MYVCVHALAFSVESAKSTLFFLVWQAATDTGRSTRRVHKFSLAENLTRERTPFPKPHSPRLLSPDTGITVYTSGPVISTKREIRACLTPFFLSSAAIMYVCVHALAFSVESAKSTLFFLVWQAAADTGRSTRRAHKFSLIEILRFFKNML